MCNSHSLNLNAQLPLTYLNVLYWNGFQSPFGSNGSDKLFRHGKLCVFITALLIAITIIVIISPVVHDGHLWRFGRGYLSGFYTRRSQVERDALTIINRYRWACSYNKRTLYKNRQNKSKLITFTDNLTLEFLGRYNFQRRNYIVNHKTNYNLN